MPLRCPVLRDLYGPLRMLCGLGNIRTIGGAISVRSVVQGLTGSCEARKCTLGLYLPSQTDYVTFDPLGLGRLLTGLLWQEIAGSPCLKVVHAQPSSAAGYTAHFKIFRNIVRTRNACRVISHALTQVWPLRGP